MDLVVHSATKYLNGHSDIIAGVESLVSMPFNTSHAGLSQEEKNRMGIREGLVRLSCGIEDAEDLIEDIDQALGMIR